MISHTFASGSFMSVRISSASTASVLSLSTLLSLISLSLGSRRRRHLGEGRGQPAVLVASQLDALDPGTREIRLLVRQPELLRLLPRGVAGELDEVWI